MVIFSFPTISLQEEISISHSSFPSAKLKYIIRIKEMSINFFCKYRWEEEWFMFRYRGVEEWVLHRYRGENKRVLFTV